MASIILPDALTLAHYRFTLIADTPIYLPPYKGSALRGGFGHAFKRMVCFQPDVKTCGGCLLRYTCPYAYVFEMPTPEDAEVLRANEDAPLPLIITPPLDRRTDYAPGDALVFHITLIGRAADYLPYFLIAFQELGRRGLGRGRGRYHLARVEAVNPLTQATDNVYDMAQPTHIHACALTVDGGQVQAVAEKLSPERLTVELTTPTRIKHQAQFVFNGPPFDALVKALLGRISSLSYFHCGERWETDFRGWIDRAAEIEIVSADTSWAQWERYSGRQQQRISMGGLVGTVTYTGDLAPYRALLALGTLIHAGKGTVFGNGRLQLV